MDLTENQSLLPFGTPRTAQRRSVIKEGPQLMADTLLNCYFQEILGPRTYGRLLNVGAGDVSRQYGHDAMFAASVYHTFETPDSPLPATYRGTVTAMHDIADESYDWVISIAMLEHVDDPFRAAAEMLRVTKAGGYLYVLVPFSQVMHYEFSYSDFWRFTPRGLAALFAPAVPVEIELWGDSPAQPNGIAALLHKGQGSRPRSFWIEFPNDQPWWLYEPTSTTALSWMIHRLKSDPLDLAHHLGNLRNAYAMQHKVNLPFPQMWSLIRHEHALPLGVLGMTGGYSYFRPLDGTLT